MTATCGSVREVDLSIVSARFGVAVEGDVGLVTNLVNETAYEFRKMASLMDGGDVMVVDGSPLAAYCELVRRLYGVHIEVANELTDALVDRYVARFGHPPPYPWAKTSTHGLLSANPDPGGV